MRGVISAIAPDGSYGQVSTADGQRFSYWTSEIRNGQAKVGQAVEFEMQDDQPVGIVILPPAPPRPSAAPRSPMPQRSQGMPAQGAPRRMQPDAEMQRGAPNYSAAAEPPKGNYWVRLLTSPSGRITRKQFWLHGVLPIIAASILLGWIPIIGQLISLALLWASVCIAFKRFHDLGYPGWWSLVYLIPLLAAGVVFGLSFYYFESDWPVTLAKILWAVGGLLMLAQLVLVYVRAGEQGPNQYGPDPLAAY
jgi:uncharacterized membrane protein YhaH (DUF805 family)